MDSQELERLQQENEELKALFRQQQEDQKKKRDRVFWATKKMGSAYLGGDLKTSIQKLFDEIDRKDVSKETLAEVTALLFRRIIKVGFWGLVLALLPMTFLVLQTALLYQQNEKMDQQNRKIDQQNERMIQQTYLQEAERRSSLIFLFNDILNDINDEKKKGYNDLSPELIGRIVSLSHAFKPYNYLDGDSLIAKPISPERGQLLLALLESDLDTSTYNAIFKRGNFTHSELAGFDLSNKYLSWIDLQHSNLHNAVFTNTKINFAQLQSTDCRSANFNQADLSYSYFDNSIFQNATLKNCVAKASLFRNTNFVNANFSEADVRYSTFEDSKMDSVDFTKAILYNPFHFRYVCSTRPGGEWSNYDSISQKAMAFFKIPGKMIPGFGQAYVYRSLIVRFQNCSLINADFRFATIDGANFKNADLSKADFCGTNLYRSNFNGALLAETNLNSTIISFSILQSAFTQGAKLDKCMALGEHLKLEKVQKGKNFNTVEEKIQALEKEAFRLPEHYLVDTLRAIRAKNFERDCPVDSYASDMTSASGIPDTFNMELEKLKVKNIASTLQKMYEMQDACIQIEDTPIMNQLPSIHNVNGKKGVDIITDFFYYKEISQNDQLRFYRILKQQRKETQHRLKLYQIGSQYKVIDELSLY